MTGGKAYARSRAVSKHALAPHDTRVGRTAALRPRLTVRYCQLIFLEDCKAVPPLLPAAQAALPPSKPLRPHSSAHIAVREVLTLNVSILPACRQAKPFFEPRIPPPAARLPARQGYFRPEKPAGAACQ